MLALADPGCPAGSRVVNSRCTDFGQNIKVKKPGGIMGGGIGSTPESTNQWFAFHSKVLTTYHCHDHNTGTNSYDQVQKCLQPFISEN